MLTMITNIPLFVWPLFAFLLIGGLKARKTHMTSLRLLMLVPSAFLIWSLISFFGRYVNDSLSVILWILCLAGGVWIGFSHAQRLKLRFEKNMKRIEIVGSWIPLVLSMSIFTSKFSLGMMRAMLPHLQDSMVFLWIELFSSLILGVMVGRSAGCFVRYRSAKEEAIK